MATQNLILIMKVFVHNKLIGQNPATKSMDISKKELSTGITFYPDKCNDIVRICLKKEFFSTL